MYRVEVSLSAFGLPDDACWQSVKETKHDVFVPEHALQVHMSVPNVSFMQIQILLLGQTCYEVKLAIVKKEVGQSSCMLADL